MEVFFISRFRKAGLGWGSESGGRFLLLPWILGESNLKQVENHHHHESDQVDAEWR